MTEVRRLMTDEDRARMLGALPPRATAADICEWFFTMSAAYDLSDDAVRVMLGVMGRAVLAGEYERFLLQKDGSQPGDRLQ